MSWIFTINVQRRLDSKIKCNISHVKIQGEQLQNKFAKLNSVKCVRSKEYLDVRNIKWRSWDCCARISGMAMHWTKVVVKSTS